MDPYPSMAKLVARCQVESFASMDHSLSYSKPRTAPEPKGVRFSDRQPSSLDINSTLPTQTSLTSVWFNDTPEKTQKPKKRLSNRIISIRDSFRTTAKTAVLRGESIGAVLSVTKNDVPLFQYPQDPIRGAWIELPNPAIRAPFLVREFRSSLSMAAAGMDGVRSAGIDREGRDRVEKLMPSKDGDKVDVVDDDCSLYSQDAVVPKHQRDASDSQGLLRQRRKAFATANPHWQENPDICQPVRHAQQMLKRHFSEHEASVSEKSVAVAESSVSRDAAIVESSPPASASRFSASTVSTTKRSADRDSSASKKRVTRLSVHVEVEKAASHHESNLPVPKPANDVVLWYTCGRPADAIEDKEVYDSSEGAKFCERPDPAEIWQAVWDNRTIPIRTKSTVLKDAHLLSADAWKSPSSPQRQRKSGPNVSARSRFSIEQDPLADADAVADAQYAPNEDEAGSIWDDVSCCSSSLSSKKTHSPPFQYSLHSMQASPTQHRTQDPAPHSSFPICSILSDKNLRDISASPPSSPLQRIFSQTKARQVSTTPPSSARESMLWEFLETRESSWSTAEVNAANEAEKVDCDKLEEIIDSYLDDNTHAPIVMSQELVQSELGESRRRRRPSVSMEMPEPLRIIKRRPTKPVSNETVVQNTSVPNDESLPSAEPSGQQSTSSRLPIRNWSEMLKRTNSNKTASSQSLQSILSGMRIALPTTSVQDVQKWTNRGKGSTGSNLEEQK